MTTRSHSISQKGACRIVFRRIRAEIATANPPEVLCWHSPCHMVVALPSGGMNGEKMVDLFSEEADGPGWRYMDNRVGH